MMKRTMLSSVMSVLAAGVLMGGCDVDEEVGEDSELLAEEGSKAGGGEESEALAVEELKAGGGEANTPTCGVLAAGETLFAGQSRTSCNGLYTLVMQAGDGNLVLYGPAGAAAATYAYGAGNRVVMQTDGNLVVYTPSNVPVWHSHTYGRPGARLAIQDDGNLVIYTPSNQVLRQSGNLGGGQVKNLQEWNQPLNVQPFQCIMFRGWGQPWADRYYSYQGCGNSGEWLSANRPDYPGWQIPSIDGVLGPLSWATTNNSPVTVTTSAAERDSFTANTEKYGSCAFCVQ